MQHLAKVILRMAVLFLIIFSIAKLTGFLTIDQVKYWLTTARALSPFYMGSLVIALLIIDLFLTMPTMTIIALAGYFLGFQNGALISMVGLLSTGIIGYGLSFRYGNRALRLLLKEPEEQYQAKESFQKHGSMIIILSRAVPMLPEISSYLAGTTKMPFEKFFLAWFINVLPYVLLIAYAGSISSIDDPKPAFYTAIGISTTLWIGWYFFNARRKTGF